MKKRGLLIASALLISTLTGMFITSCDKDTNSYLHVTVVDETDKSKTFEGAEVKVDMNGSAVKREGLTDANGEFFTSFPAPAVFNVQAIYEIAEQSNSTTKVYREGKGSARLKDGDTAYVTVALGTELKSVPR